MKKLLLPIFIIFSSFLINVSFVKAEVPEECKDSEYKCIKCTYKYDGIVKNDFDGNGEIYYIAKSDGTGLVSLSTKGLTRISTGRKTITVNNLVSNDFLNSDKTNLECPNITYEESSSKGAYTTDYTLTIKKTSSSDVNGVSTILEEKNDKSFYGNSGKSSKTCRLVNKNSDIPEIIATYHGDTKTSDFSVVVPEGYDASAYTINTNFSKSAEVIFSNDCNNVELYAKIKDTGNSMIHHYQIDIVDTPTTGYKPFNAGEDTTEEKRRVIKPSDKTDCRSILDSEVRKLLNNILKTIQYAGPILVTVFTIIDLIKASVTGDAGELKKVYQKLIKRLIAAVLLFFVPTLVNLIIDLVDNSMLPKSCL